MGKNYLELENLMDLNLSLDSKIILLWQRKGWGLYPSDNAKNLKQLIKKGRAKYSLEIGCPHTILPLINNDKNYNKVMDAFTNMNRLPCYTEFYPRGNLLYLNRQEIYPLESILFDGDLSLFLDKKFYRNIHPQLPQINIEFPFISFVSIHCINRYKERNFFT